MFKRILTIALVLVLGTVGVPATSWAAEIGASACEYANGWIDPGCATGNSTVFEYWEGELRIGYYNGKQYGWGRWRAGYPQQFKQLYLEVDLDGDRHYDDISAVMSNGYTWGYPTSPDRKRAFRICLWEHITPRYTCSGWW